LFQNLEGKLRVVFNLILNKILGFLLLEGGANLGKRLVGLSVQIVYRHFELIIIVSINALTQTKKFLLFDLLA